MKVLHHVKPSCDCTEKLWRFYNEQRGSDRLEPGSVMECDCGQAWRLDHDYSEDKGFWVRVANMDNTWK
jgi:hypothetical protein